MAYPRANTPPLLARSPAPRGDSIAQLLCTIRDHRFASGVACVRCGGTRVTRWGSFASRQRYRCKECRRTFSDLTATPMAYTKQLGSWPLHLRLMRRGVTIRRAAAELGVFGSTAFRWRHATLNGLRRSPAPRLTGWIELREIGFAHSEKGSRQLSHAPRRRGARSNFHVWFATPREYVALLRSRAGVVRSLTFQYGVPDVQSLDDFFSRHVVGPATLLTYQYRCTMHGHSARRCGHAHVRLDRLGGKTDVVRHVANVYLYADRLEEWLLRFRGIATRYLDNYLQWHRWVDEDAGHAWLERFMAAAVGTNNSAEHSGRGRHEGGPPAGPAPGGAAIQPPAGLSEPSAATARYRASTAPPGSTTTRSYSRRRSSSTHAPGD